jgi:phytanoyl-CoA hydroxylase
MLHVSVLYILHNANVPSTHVSAGDTIFFHPLLVHGSGPNLSSSYRRAVSCHYASSQVSPIDVRDTLQAHVAEEVLAMRRLTCQYIDVWRMKSRHIAGRTGTAFQDE